MFKKSIQVISILMTFFLSILVFKQIYYAPLTFDESFNLQIPISLIKTGQYKSLYIPERPYDARISVGYPLHIGQSIFFALFGINRTTVRFYSIFLYLILLFTIWLITRNAITLLFLQFLFLVSPTFASTSTFYLGENSALIVLLLGYYFLVKHKNLILSCLFMSFAVHLKIHSIAFLPLFLLFTQKKTIYIVYFLYFFLLGFLFFFLSTYLIGFTNTPFILYIKKYYWDYKTFIILNSGLSSYNMLSPIPNFLNNLKTYSPNILNAFLLSTALFALKKYKYWVLPLFFVIIYASLFKGNKNFEFIVLALFFIYLSSRSGKTVTYICTIYILINIPFAVNTLKIFDTQIESSKLLIKRQEKTAAYIRTLKQDIYTNNWWQIPEISFLADVQFRDRMQFTGIKKGYLFFNSLQDKTYWPTVDMKSACEKVLYCKYGYGVCKLKSNFVINTNIFPKPSINLKNCPIL